MGLDIGVVKIEYLERPDPPVYDFLWHLAEMAGGDDVWGGSWEGNAFVEMLRDQMLARAEVFAQERQLSPEEFDGLIAWVEALPWHGDTVMLHMNW